MRKSHQSGRFRGVFAGLWLVFARCSDDGEAFLEGFQVWGAMGIPVGVVGDGTGGHESSEYKVQSSEFRVQSAEFRGLTGAGGWCYCVLM